MEYLIFVFFCIFIYFLIKKEGGINDSEYKENNLIHNEKPQSSSPRLPYTAKRTPMSERELKFFHNLELLIGDKYYIVPQVHLSTILQTYRVPHYYRFNPDLNKISGKSVDFALFTKPDYQFKLAIELDDSTHRREDRIIRDRFVDSVMSSAGQKLVRMNSFDVTKVVEEL